MNANLPALREDTLIPITNIRARPEIPPTFANATDLTAVMFRRTDFVYYGRYSKPLHEGDKGKISRPKLILFWSQGRIARRPKVQPEHAVWISMPFHQCVVPDTRFISAIDAVPVAPSL